MDKYKEALEKARAEYEKAREQGYTWLMGLLEGMFPDLKESEDEKIRKWIIDELKDSLHEIETMYSGDYDNRDEQDKERQEYLNKALAWLEKQKPIELEQLAKLREMTHEIRDAYKRGIEVGRVESQQEWSEEDKKMIDHLIEALPMWATGRIAMLPSQAEEYVKRLKSLPERFNLQPMQEWSEKDERMQNQLIYDVEYHKKEALVSAKKNKVTKALYDGIEECYDEKINWLKSLRPQPHWKPSKEQMEAFRSYIKDFQEKAEAAVGGWNNFDVMIRLYEHLKELGVKEEPEDYQYFEEIEVNQDLI